MSVSLRWICAAPTGNVSIPNKDIDVNVILDGSQIRPRKMAFHRAVLMIEEEVAGQRLTTVVVKLIFQEQPFDPSVAVHLTS